MAINNNYLSIIIISGLIKILFAYIEMKCVFIY